jgi:lysophospholipase L1-like esterase
LEYAQPIPPAASPRRAVVLRALSLALGIVLGIASATAAWIAGGVLVARGRLRVVDTFVHHGLRPGFSGTETWGAAAVPYFVNDLGFRDRAVRRVPPITRAGRRLLLLGDSFTEGLGLGYEESLAGELEAELRRRSADVEVLNGGVASYSPFLSERVLRRFLEAGYEADELVLLLDVSDVQDEAVGDYERLGETGRFPPLWRRRLDDWARGPQAFWETTRFASHEEKVDYYAVRDRWTEDDALWERFGRLGVERCRRSVRRLRDLAAGRGIRLRIAIYPWLTQIDSPRMPSRAQRAFAELAASLGLPLTDAFPEFRAHPDPRSLFGSGDVHWNAAGAALMAQRLARDLADGASSGSRPSPRR